MRKFRLSLALVAFLGMGVVGCAPVEAPSLATSPSSPSPTPTPTPTEEAPVATEIVITSEGFDIVDDDGAVLDGFTFFDVSSEPAIAAVTELFGAPLESAIDPGMHGPGGTILDWSGFELWDYDRETSFPDGNSFRLVVKAASVGGVLIETADGIKVGDSGATIAEVAYRDWLDTGGTSDIHFYLLDQTPVEASGLYPDYEPAAFSIGVWVDPSNDLAYRINAPTTNWGA